MKLLNICFITFACGGLASAAILNARDACNADNCLRAVRGRLPSASSDCSSYLTTTTTTLASTTALSTTIATAPTTTVTETKYSAVGGSVITPGPDPPPYPEAGSQKVRRELAAAEEEVIARRQAATTTRAAFPTYATACSSAARYASACSCISVSAVATTTTTATIPVTTSTTYLSTRIAYTTRPVCDPKENFGLKYNSLGISAPDGNTNYEYGNIPVSSPQECCVACFRAKGCSIFGYLPRGDGTFICDFTTFQGGPVKDPNDAICPYGQTYLRGDPGQSYFAFGPCALGCRVMHKPNGDPYCA